MKRVIIRGLSVMLIAICLLNYNLVVFAENEGISEYEDYSRVSNKALDLIRKIESNIPREVLREDIVGDLPTESYAKYSRFLFYLEEFESLASREGNKLTTEKDSLEAYQNSRTSLSEVFGGITTSEESSQYVLDNMETDINLIVENVLNSSGSGASEYRAEFSKIREKMKIWGDFIYFMRNDIGMEDEDYQKQVMKYDKMFNGLQRVNQITGEDMNLGFTRPQDTFDASIISADSITDENDDLQQWYVEVLSLTSKIRAGEKMEDYEHLLSTDAKEMYNKYKSYRAPLYTSLDKDPFKGLLKDSRVTLTQTNFTDIVENIEEDMVFYLPRGNKIVGKTKSLAVEEIEEGGEGASTDSNFVPSTVTEDNLMKAESKFLPVYAKSSKRQIFNSNETDGFAGDETMVIKQTAALMNHMQLINYYESGHMNDLGTDLGRPLFMDLFGNITTYTGIVLVPSLANVTYMAGSNYMPFNAFFLNNYPNESTGREIYMLNLFTTDPKKYVIALNTYGDKLSESEEDDLGNKDVREFDQTTFTLAKFHKKGVINKEYKIGFLDNNFNTNLLPNLLLYVETSEGKHPFMRITEMNKNALLKMNRYNIAGLKEQIAVTDEGKDVRFTNIHEDVPVEQWVFNHYWGEEGDKRLLKNSMFMEIAQTLLNTDIDFDIIKVENGIVKKPGFKLGSILEPIHKMISESSTNYILYTPSISELPGMDRYSSTLMIPALTILFLVAFLFAILDAIRAPNIEWSKLAVTLLVIIGTNWLVTNFYPAMLNTGFNGAMTRIMRNKTDHLALYNVEKDLNSKGEFVYTDKPSKIISDGASIKIGELEKNEAKRLRKAEEGAPWKDSVYYSPKWDPDEMHIGHTVYVKGDTLNIYVKDLFESSTLVHDGVKYNLEWYNFPDYAYYIPYLNILEGLTHTVNEYSLGNITPKKIRYSNGYTGTTGISLAYFMSEVFLTDEASAYARGSNDPSFQESWETHNNSDFLNLQAVLRMEENEELNIKPKMEFPFETDFRTKTTRWYKTAVNGRKERDIARKIKNINLSTRQYAMELLPYMDNITDEIILQSIALHATKEFSKEFSHNYFEKAKFSKDYLMGMVNQRDGQDYFTDLYPKYIDISSITFDEHMKLSLVNMHDLLKFHITALYPYIESQATWFGMLIFFIISILMFIKSLLRITFISIIVMAGFLYMVLVYAIRRDYSNKTVFGVMQIIMISWFMYLIDNLIFLAFINFDKGSAGVLFLLMTIWLIWNVTSLAVYVQLFLYFYRDIKAFGGNVFLENANAVLGGVTKLAQAVVRPFSETTAENIDFTNPNWEMKQEDFEEYLNKDGETKLQEIKDDTHNTLIGATEAMKGKIYDKIDQVPTLRGEYLKGVEQGLQGDDMYAIQALVLPPGVKDYLEYRNVQVGDGLWGNEMKATMDTWKNIMNDSEIKSESFELFKQGQDGNLYMPPTALSRDLLNRTGVDFTDLNESFAIRGTDINKVEDFAEAMKSPLYKINRDKKDALDIVESKLSPNSYEIGNNAVYIKNQTDADSLFPEENELTYQTMFNITDRQDKLRGGGYINSTMDVVNGSLVTSEYVYGKVSKSIQRSLLSEDVRLFEIGNERYKFNRDDREQVLEAVTNGVKYTDSEEGILFREKAILDKFIVNKGSEEVKPEQHDPNTNKTPLPVNEDNFKKTDKDVESDLNRGDENVPFITMELDED